MNKKKSAARVPWSIFAAIVLAFIVGSLLGKDSQFLGLSF